MLNGKKRADSAARLSRLGVQLRGSIRTRGTLYVAAHDRFADRSAQERLRRALEDTDSEARCHIALALGEWGGEDSVAGLEELLLKDPNEEVRLYSVAALKLIGGNRSALALALAAQTSTEAVRETSLLAIQELATGGGPTDMDGSSEARRRDVTGWTVGTRGAVPVRSDLAEKPQGRLAKAVISVRDDSSLPDYLRQKAAEVMEYLD